MVCLFYVWGSNVFKCSVRCLSGSMKGMQRGGGEGGRRARLEADGKEKNAPLLFFLAHASTATGHPPLVACGGAGDAPAAPDASWLVRR
jgi:hypothetical protein